MRAHESFCLLSQSVLYFVMDYTKQFNYYQHLVPLFEWRPRKAVVRKAGIRERAKVWWDFTPIEWIEEELPSCRCVIDVIL